MLDKIVTKTREGNVLDVGHGFKLGVVVFFYTAGNVWNQNGITHVGIVVDFKNGSPVIAHAANSGVHKHVLLSRLRAIDNGEKQHYIVVDLGLDEKQIELIVMIASSLSTSQAGDEKVVHYSCNRSKNLSILTQHFYQQHMGKNLDASVSDIMKNHLRYAHDLFKCPNETAGIYTSIAKMLNYTHSNLHKGASNDLKRFARKSKSSEWSPQQQPLTHEGWHCVQFVVMVLQISQLLTDVELSGLYNYNHIHSMSDKEYYSKKQKSAFWVHPKNQQVFQRVHPKKAILYGYVKEFREKFISAAAAIPFESKFLSPAALLYFMSGGGFPGLSGGHFRLSMPFASINTFAFIKSSIQSIKSSIEQSNLDFTISHKVNQILELQVIKTIIQSFRLRAIYVPRSIPLRMLRPLKRSAPSQQRSHDDEAQTKAPRRQGGAGGGI